MGEYGNDTAIFHESQRYLNVFLGGKMKVLSGWNQYKNLLVEIR